ncbi:hypothetical protein BSKO_01921 [Bryopsis sp. KO-2023]|nr:hypothetical protein BSKO_01921 [Bryopsis sp. KO-2023]
MVRSLRHHEKKLLKKVDFLNYRRENEAREQKIIQRYCLQERDDYKKYNGVCGKIMKLIEALKQLDQDDPTRIELTDLLLEKLYLAGVVPLKQSLATAERVGVSSFARRRLAVIMTKMKMAPQIREAATFVEQGHVRVGVDIVTDPAYHISRSMEDHVTWVDTSKIKRKVLRYNDKLDDYDILN